MGTRKVERGDIGHVVATQVRRKREQKQLSLQALSDRLTALGRPILPSGLSKIEQGTRRVDVDDLVALAHALGTVPSALLLDSVAVDVTRDPDDEHEKAVDAAVAALRRCEKVGASRYEVVEWMNAVDAVKPFLDALMRSHPAYAQIKGTAERIAALAAARQRLH